MATRIQEILERIDKLKSSLQEKVVLLDERTRANEALKKQVSELEAERDDLSRKLEKSASAQPQRSEAFMAAERVEAITRLQREIQKAREQNFQLKKALREAGGDPKAVLGDDSATPSPDVAGVPTSEDSATIEQIEKLQSELSAARTQAAGVEKHLAEREHELSHRDEELAAAHERAAELTEKLTEVENLLTTVRERSSPDLVASAEELAAKERRIAELEMEVARARQMTPPIDSEAEVPSVDEDADAAELMQLITIQQEQIQELTDKLTEVAEQDLALAELMSQIAELETGLAEKDAVINELMEQVVGE